MHKNTLKDVVRIRHVIVGILPSVKITNLHRDADSATNDSSDILRRMGSPVKSRRKWVERIRRLTEGLYSIGLRVPRYRTSAKVNPTEKLKIRTKLHRHILQRHITSRTKNTPEKKERFHRKNAIFVSQILEIGHFKCVLLSCRSLGNGGTLFAKARRARIRNRLRSVNGHAEQKGFKVWRTGNSPKIQERHNGGDGQWRSADERGSLGICSRSSSLRDCAELLEDTLAVIASGNFCEEHGYSDEWASGQNPYLMNDGKKIQCKNENFVPVVVPG